MKKLGKSFILVGMATATIAIGSLVKTAIPMEQGILRADAQAYNHKSANMLDNVFVEGNTKYLPFIFSNRTDKVTEADVRRDFSAAGLTVTAIESTDELIGTGTQIKVKENSDIYHVIVYGDVDGDGCVDTMDSYQMILHVKKPNTNALKGIYLKAGNIINDQDTVVDTMDSYQVILFQKGKITELVEIEPTSSIPSNQPPVITLRDNSDITIKVGDSFEQYLGKENIVKATNKYGGDVSNKVVITNNINKNTAGNYEIVYTVVDNGLTAKVTRKVIVEEKQNPPTPTVTVTSVEKGSDPTKTEYNYGETIDMTGATVKVNYSDGTSKNVNVTNSMITRGDLSEEGDRTITITCENKTVNFVVKVLNKITALELTETGRDKVTLNSGEYQLTTTEEFTLGTIQEKEQVGGSKLTLEQLDIEVQENGVATTGLTLEASLSGNNILLKGRATSSGKYTATISIYDGIGKVTFETDINVESIFTRMELVGATTKIQIGATERRYEIHLLDQYNEVMENKRINEFSEIADNENVESGKIGYIVPELPMIIDGEITEDLTVPGLNVKFYANRDDTAEGGGSASANYIGVSYNTNTEDWYEINVDSLNKEKLQFVFDNGNKLELDIEVI